MSKNKSTFSISKLVREQKSKDLSNAKPMNLEALVNSGRVRVGNQELKKVLPSKKK